MEHPLKEKRFIFYVGLWGLIITLHAFFLSYQFKFPFKTCLTDSVIFNGLAAVACFFYWYVVKYISPNRQNIFESIISYFIAMLCFVMAISFLSNSVLRMLFSEVEWYSSFLKNTLLFRMILATLYLTIVIMFYYLLIYLNDINEQQQKEKDLQNLLKQTSLDMLLFQINPHFLFNSLNSISSLTITAPSQAREMVIKLADFFRTSLSERDDDLQTLREELDQMNLYLDIEKIRFEERLIIDLVIDQECLDMKVPRMILQPLYENAIKFGVYENLGKSTIKTICTCSEGNLNVIIINNSSSEGLQKKGTGVGINNVKKRLTLLYGLDNLVKIKQQDDSYAIHLVIPQNTGK